MSARGASKPKGAAAGSPVLTAWVACVMPGTLGGAAR
jgi:hypothetical protein